VERKFRIKEKLKAPNEQHATKLWKILPEPARLNTHMMCVTNSET